MPATVTIERLGTDGAGLTHLNGKLVAVAGALPGEQVRLSPATPPRAEAILSPSPDRIDPRCRHFGRCGGCTLQHLGAKPYEAFKRQLVVDALSRVGLTGVEVRPIVSGGVSSRRRTTLAALRNRHGVILGYHAAARHQLIDIKECPILVPALERLLDPLRELLKSLLQPAEKTSILLTETMTGTDAGFVLVRAPGLAQLELLADFAATADLARLWWRGYNTAPSPIAERRRPMLRFGEISVVLPPGGFLQATGFGEAAMIATAERAVTGSQRIADLFSGIGTFTLALSGRHTVHAVDSDAPAVSALSAALRGAGRGACSVERRDLFKRPLSRDELDRFDAVLFDPPRAGAMAQTRELAHARVPLLVAVSCNPATFARDAATLVAGGYRLETVLPIDQFLWSAHVELIAALRRV